MPDAVPSVISASDVVSATPVASSTPASIPASDVVSATPVAPARIDPSQVTSAAPNADYLKTLSPGDIVGSLYTQMNGDPALKAAYADGTMTPEQEAEVKPYQDAYAARADQMAKEGGNFLHPGDLLDAYAPTSGPSQPGVLTTALNVLTGLPKVAEDLDSATMEHVGDMFTGVTGIDPFIGRVVTPEEQATAKNNAFTTSKVQAFQAANVVRKFTNRVANAFFAASGDKQISDIAYKDQFDTDLKAKYAEEGLTQGSSLFGPGYDKKTDPEAVKREAGSALNPMVYIPGGEGFAAGRGEGFAARTLENAAADTSATRSMRQVVGKTMAVPLRAAAAVAKPVANAVENNPLVAGTLAGATSLALKGSPADALLATLTAAGGGGTKVLSRIISGVENKAAGLAGDVPNGPFSRFALKAFDTAGDHALGAITAQLGNTPFLLGSDNREQFEDNMSFGLVAHAAGYAGGSVANALDIRKNLFSTLPTLPESRTPVKDYGTNPVLDAAHQNIVSQLGNTGSNFVQAVRDYVGKRGQLYTLSPSDYASALDAAAKAGHISQATADQGKGQRGITYTIPADPAVQDGKPTSVALNKVGQNTPGISVGHEAGHLIWNLLSPEEQAHWTTQVNATYGEDGVNQYGAQYVKLANKGLQPGDPAVSPLTPSQIADEIFAEHASAVLNSVPIAQFSDPTLSGVPSFAHTAYSLIGRGLEKLKLNVPELTEGNGGTKTGTGIEPSAKLGHIVENVLQAHKLDEPILNGTQEPGTPYRAQSVPTGQKVVDEPPAFKKGDPLDVVQNGQGTEIGKGGVITKVLGRGTLTDGKFTQDEEGMPHYVVEHTATSGPNEGKRVTQVVPEKWLQSAQKNAAEAGESSDNRPTEEANQPNTPASSATAAEKPFTPTTPIRSSDKAVLDAFGNAAKPGDSAEHNKALFKDIIANPNAPGRAVEITHVGAESPKKNAGQLAREGERLGRLTNTPNGKVIVPFAENKKGDGVFALDTHKILQNFDTLAAATKDPFYTSGRAVKALQDYLRNQSEGFTGGGKPLTRLSDERANTIPAHNKAYTSVPIPDDEVQKLNVAMGYPKPKGLRDPEKTRADDDFFRRLAEANGRKTTKTSAGFTETNPYRAQLEKSGFNTADLHDATSQIMYKDIAGKAKPRPELNATRGSTGITKAGFMPNTDRVTDTPEFKRWFGESKVVDESGKPLVVYKAMYPFDWRDETNKEPLSVINRPTEHPAFNHGEAGVKIAGFFGDIKTANRFAEGAGDGQAIYPSFLSLENPKVIDAKGEKAGNIQFGSSGKPFRDAIRSGKYDGVIVKNTADEGTIYVALKPEQIKSATGNNGKFDPKNPDIRFMPSPAERTKGEEMESALRAQGFTIEKEGGAGKYIGTRIEKNGKLIGFIAAEENPANKSAEILNVHVNPEFRGRGIGEVLYRNLARNLQDIGVESVHGSVMSKAAHNLRTKILGPSEESGDLGYKYADLPETWENKSGQPPHMRLDSKIDPETRYMPSVGAENEHAKYIGEQDDGAGGHFPLFNLKHDIEGHPKDSTVGPDTLKKAGIPLPGEYVESTHTLNGRFMPPADASKEHVDRAAIRLPDEKNKDGSTGVPGTPSFMPNPSKEPFYDTIDRALDSWQPKGTPEQLLAHLSKTKGTKEQAAWIGLDDFLKDKKSVTKEDVRSFVRNNAVHVRDITLGGGESVKTARDKMKNAASLQNAIGGELVHKAVTEFKMSRLDAMNLPGRLSDGRIPVESLPFGLRQRAQDYLETERGHTAARDAWSRLEDSDQKDTKYEAYQLPGGENYREFLLTLPQRPQAPASARLEELKDKRDSGAHLNTQEKEELNTLIGERARNTEAHLDARFRSSHFDEPNILAHVRYNEREIPHDYGVTDAINARIAAALNAKPHSLGSGAAEAAVNKGAITPEEAKVWSEKKEMRNKYNPQGGPHGSKMLFLEEVQSDWHQQGRQKGYSTISGVPEAPFKTSWPALAMKRMIRLAAEKGMDKIGWTTGEQQAERYDLSKQVHSIGVDKNLDGSYLVYAKEKPQDVNRVLSGNAKESDLANIIGKELAKQAVEKTKDWKTSFTASGEGLKVGGEGMKGFYDKILPGIANELGKKFGARVSSSDLPASERLSFAEPAHGPVRVHTFDITPEMKASALQGLPMFQPNAEKGLSGAKATSKKSSLAGVTTAPSKKKKLAP